LTEADLILVLEAMVGREQPVECAAMAVVALEDTAGMVALAEISRLTTA
jgi:hypothetical protein